MRHFGLIVRDEEQLAEVREKLTKKYKLKLIEGFRCDFHDPFGNRIQVVDLHDESLVWLMPYAEAQKLGLSFKGYQKQNIQANKDHGEEAMIRKTKSNYRLCNSRKKNPKTGQAPKPRHL